MIVRHHTLGHVNTCALLHHQHAVVAVFEYGTRLCSSIPPSQFREIGRGRGRRRGRGRGRQREHARSRQEGVRRERGRDGEGQGGVERYLTPRLCLRPSIALVVHIGITLIACVCARARVHINAYPPEIRMAGLHARPRPCMLVLTHACTHERKHAHACTYKRTRSHAHAYTYTPDVQMAGLLGSHAYFPPTGNTDSHK